MFCICENDADQLRIYIDSTTLYFLKQIFKPLAIFCSCTAWFMSDQVGNPKDGFSHNEAHMLVHTMFPLSKLKAVILIASLPCSQAKKSCPLGHLFGGFDFCSDCI